MFIFQKKISKSYKWKIKNWDKVAIKISKWNDKNPEWRIIDVLWDENLNEMMLEVWF